METSYFEYLHEQMERDLQRIRDTYETPAEWAIKSIPIVQKCLAELKEHILEHPFKRRSEEIEFFKRMKPTITSQLIFLTEVFNWWNDRIVEDNPNKQRRYWADKRKFIRAYFRKQVVLYSYLVNDYKWLDVQFFVRRQRTVFYYWGIPNELDPVCLLADPEFSTSHDHRVAKLIAYKMLDEFCRQQLMGSAAIQRLPEIEDFSEPKYNLVPLLRRYDSLFTYAKVSGLITRKEMSLLLHRFMRVNLAAAPDSKTLDRYRSNSSLSKRIRKEIKQFRVMWKAENEDVEYDNPIN